MLPDEESSQYQGDDSTHDPITTGGLDLEKDARSSWRMLAPFLLLVCLVPVLVFKLRTMGSQAVRSSSMVRDCGSAGIYPVVVQKGDTCWDLTQKYTLTLDELHELNRDLKCESLLIGEVVCLKTSLQT